MPRVCREVHLVRRPDGVPVPADFALVEVDVPEPGPNEFVVRNAYLGVDPFLRLFMSGPRTNKNLYPLNQAPPGLAVGRVIASRCGDFPEGAWAVGPLGWREYALSDGAGIRIFDSELGDPSWALGPLGLSGLTAWAGTQVVAKPTAGELMYISAAAGAVGNLVGQLSKLRGTRVIGSAGQAEKVAWLLELGFDEAINYREADIAESLESLAPNGLDIAFDNVGGAQLGAMIGAMHEFGRIISCGAISVYNAGEDCLGPQNFHLVFMRSLRIQGFRWRDHTDRWQEFSEQMSAWLRDGNVKFTERVVNGIERTGAAFAEGLIGEGVGKTVVKIGPAD